MWRDYCIKDSRNCTKDCPDCHYKMQNCPKCGNIVIEDQNICDVCGEVIT